MAITGGSRRLVWRAVGALLAVAFANCTSKPVPVRQPTPAPSPAPRAPSPPSRVPSPPARAPSPASGEIEIRIGLVVGASSASLSGVGPVAANEPDGSRIITIPAGETWQVQVAGDGLRLASPAGWVSGPLDALTLVAVDPRAPLRVNRKAYRGQAEILRDRTGLTVVNRLGLESYLLGVVSTEMGKRTSAEQAALRAQAVVSRTYALRNMGRWRAQGFDLYATVSDQAYGGVSAETLEGRAAVSETWGRVLTYNGALIEAFFFSTCSGRTTDGFEVFRGASRPYLRPVSDVSGSGVAYCSISPRYRWREEWTGETLRASLRQYLSQVSAGGSDRTGAIEDIRVTGRSASGRVNQLAIRVGGSELRVDGHTNIRQALRTPAGDMLRSSAFTLLATGAGSRITHLVADGMGAGHGVGLCQWGSVGRARAGQGYEQILSAYYPGTSLERRY